jgi:hypothetical protein
LTPITSTYGIEYTDSQLPRWGKLKGTGEGKYLEKMYSKQAYGQKE